MKSLKLLRGGVLQPIRYKNVNWKVFEFNDIFREIKRGKRLTKANQINGKTPYVSSSAINNGVDNFISNNKNVRKFKNALSIANSGSVGSTFYHKYEYVASDHITSLIIENPDENIYLFMSTIVKRLEEKYSFNRKINDSRIQREKLILPADENGNPDFDYMRKFITKIQKENIEQTLEYIYIYIISTIITTYRKELVLKNIEWKEFKIKEIFTIFTGSLIKKNLMKKGVIPRITATDINNGISLFTDNISDKKFNKYSNFISISFLGSVFYQRNEVSLDMKIHGIKIKNKELNKEIALFLIPLIKNFTFKFSYGYQLSTSMLKIQKLMLPIDKNGNPNWQFMENYIKLMEAEEYINIIKYELGVVH